jgi:hypothetical protein
MLVFGIFGSIFGMFGIFGIFGSIFGMFDIFGMFYVRYLWYVWLTVLKRLTVCLIHGMFDSRIGNDFFCKTPQNNHTAKVDMLMEPHRLRQGPTSDTTS